MTVNCALIKCACGKTCMDHEMLKVMIDNAEIEASRSKSDSEVNE